MVDLHSLLDTAIFAATLCVTIFIYRMAKRSALFQSPERKLVMASNALIESLLSFDYSLRHNKDNHKQYGDWVDDNYGRLVKLYDLFFFEEELKKPIQKLLNAAGALDDRIPVLHSTRQSSEMRDRSALNPNNLNRAVKAFKEIKRRTKITENTPAELRWGDYVEERQLDVKTKEQFKSKGWLPFYLEPYNFGFTDEVT